jgi:hypothetical protein
MTKRFKEHTIACSKTKLHTDSVNTDRAGKNWLSATAGKGVNVTRNIEFRIQLGCTFESAELL